MPTARVPATLAAFVLTGAIASWSAQPPPQPPASPDVFPGAVLDELETAFFAREGGGPAIYRTTSPFDVVVNYYRFKRKQGVHVVEAGLGARFERMALALERGVSPARLENDPFVARFHAFAAARGLSPAQAWRRYAAQFKGRVQRIGEGQRVTVYRPWISQRTFTLVEETVVVLEKPPPPSSTATAARDHIPF